MSNAIDADYSQTFLFPPSLEDFIPEDDPARFIRAFVDSLDADELGIVQKNDTDGRPPYSWRLLLSVWLYGWFEKVKGCRQLEKMCHRDLGMLWLTGMNKPDHNTIWRFYNQNQKAIKKLFKKSVHVAFKNDLVGMVLHAIDGTKIQANASRYKDISRKKLELLLSKVDTAIQTFFSTITNNNSEDLPFDSLPEELQNHHKLKEKIQSDLAELAEKGVNNLNKTDRESRLMHTRRGPVDYSYNAQAVGDSKHGIVVSADVVQDETDSHQLSSQLNNVKDAVGYNALSSVADAGYFSGEELSKADSISSDVLVSIPSRYNENQFKTSSDMHHVNNYDYDTDLDCFICPRGGELHFVSENKKNRIYKCTSFKGCVYKSECTKDKYYRRITVSKYHKNIRFHREKQTDPVVVKKMRQRQGLIEPVFGIIKERLGFRRFTVRGLDKAAAQWSFIASIYNLRKIYKHCGVGVVFS